jgi:hypothetical protein
MEIERKKLGPIFMIVLGIVLVIAGLSTSGLWPWQLPTCFFGGFIFSKGLTGLKKVKEYDESN